METGEHTPNAEQFVNYEDSELSGYELAIKENEIHPTAFIGEHVRMGKGNFIGANCIIDGYTMIGDNNHFHSFCSIGTEPEHKDYFGKKNQGIVIGNNNYFREFVTINAGCEKSTFLENHITMLRGSHIGHDSTIKSGCTISCNVLIGGHSLLGFGVNMGLGSICHQRSRIGSYAMVGMGAIITKNHQPKCFDMFVGNPAKFIKKNTFQAQNYSEQMIKDIEIEFDKMKC